MYIIYTVQTNASLETPEPALQTERMSHPERDTTHSQRPFPANCTLISNVSTEILILKKMCRQITRRIGKRSKLEKVSTLEAEFMARVRVKEPWSHNAWTANHKKVVISKNKLPHKQLWRTSVLSTPLCVSEKIMYHVHRFDWCTHNAML